MWTYVGTPEARERFERGARAARAAISRAYYEDALRGVIEQKMKGRPVKPSTDTRQDSKVVDLMAALRASLGDSPRKPRAANRNSRSGNRTGKSSKRSAA